MSMLNSPPWADPAINGPAIELLTRLSASTFAVATTISLAALAIASKYGIEIYKLVRDHLRYAREQRIAPELALKTVRLGLREMERHHGQNLRVMLTIQRGLSAGRWLPMEYHVLKFAVMPLPLWATDATLRDLPADGWNKVSKLARMIPNLQREYDQAHMLITLRDRAGFEVILPTLISKARVAIREADAVHHAIFQGNLIPLETLTSETEDKPVDYYPEPAVPRP